MVKFPINFVIGEFVIPSHLILYLLAFYIGISYYIYLRKKRGDFIQSERRWVIIIGAAMGAFIFSRLIAALENPSFFFNPPDFIYYLQAQTIVGGLLGGILGVEITKKIIKEQRSTGDLFVFPLILGIIIGRIGCFLTGVSDRTVGLPSHVIWAFDQGDGIPRHPTSLYEIFFLIILWGILMYVGKKNIRDGVLFKLFIISYFSFRLLIEFIKPINHLILNLSAIQIVSLIWALYYTIVIFMSGVIENGQNFKEQAILRSH